MPSPLPPNAPSYRSLPLWGVFLVLLAVAAISGALFRQRPEPKPWTAPGLAEHIQQTHPELRIVPLCDSSDTSWGFYLCKPFRKETSRSLRSLVHRSDCIDHWRGVVLVQKHRDDNRPGDICLEEHDVVIGSFFLFGDPEMTQLVAQQFYPKQR